MSVLRENSSCEIDLIDDEMEAAVLLIVFVAFSCASLNCSERNWALICEFFVFSAYRKTQRKLTPPTRRGEKQAKN